MVFDMQGIPFVAQPEIQLDYKGQLLNQYFKPDFSCFGKIIVELKTVSAIIDAHRAQTLNYLSALDMDLALLINFGSFPKLAYERLARTRKQESERTIREEMQSWFEAPE
jgi:GxxExxY protein